MNAQINASVPINRMQFYNRKMSQLQKFFCVSFYRNMMSQSFFFYKSFCNLHTCLAELAMVLSGKHLQLIQRKKKHGPLFTVPKKTIHASEKYQPMDTALTEQKTDKKIKSSLGLHQTFCLPRRNCWGVGCKDLEQCQG